MRKNTNSSSQNIPKQDLYLAVFMVFMTVVMIILRFLLNEKGRINPDSIRFMRTANVFPVIDNTTTPLGYPLSLKFISFFGTDLFWASKIVGILAYLFIVYFALKKRFFFKEATLVGGLFSFVSIFSFTMSEALILPFVFVFLYITNQIIREKIIGKKAFFLLSLSLITLYNIRYPALFIIGSTLLFGILNFRRQYGKIFIYSGLVGLIFVVLYKFLFIDYFNENYVSQFLEIGIHPTSKLLKELFQGLVTTFNPFIHIANPTGGIMNIGIYGIGVLNILMMIFLFVKYPLSETEKFMIFIGITGVVCSYFIQYFYSVDALDYRLLAPFSFPVWLVYFKKMYQTFGKFTYGITFLSFLTGFAFTWISKGNYLENRKEINRFLTEENLKSVPLKFYIPLDVKDLDNVQIAELISTVNSNLKFTSQPKDTLQKTTLTSYKVLKKIKINKNKYQ